MTRYRLGPEPKPGQSLLLRDGEALFPVDLEKPAAETVALFRYWLRMQRAEYRERSSKSTRAAGRPKAITEDLDYLYRAHAYRARLVVKQALIAVRSLPNRADLAQGLRVDLHERFAAWRDCVASPQVRSAPRLDINGAAMAAAIDHWAERVAASLRGAVSSKGPRAIADEITAAAFGVSARTIRALCSPKSRKETTQKP